MRLLFDDRWLGPHGIGRFAAEVAARCPMTPLGLGGKPLSLLDPALLTLALSRARPGHFFSPGFNAPLGRPCPFSLTLHDLIHLDEPAESSAAKRIYYRHVILPALGRASTVFTISEYSRRRIAEWSGLEASRIRVVGLGVGPEFTPEGPVRVHERPYLLYVGNHKPHKNVDGLLRAFAASGLAADLDLLLTGTLAPGLLDTARGLRISARLHGLGLVPEGELPALYRGARALVMPSFYEGFGLPVIEAMACGTPVLSSNRTALPEAGGDAAAYFEPYQEDSFIEGLRGLTDDARLAELRARGLRRAGQFDWNAVAGRVMQGLQDQ
jgi:glycosyltransferase involved in cell wall biosynthesis